MIYRMETEPATFFIESILKIVFILSAFCF
jgi:hypothetical protein